MASLLKVALDQGAIGLSLGPGYPPAAMQKKKNLHFWAGLLEGTPEIVDCRSPEG